MELKAEDWLYFKADEDEMIASMDIDELIYQLEQLTQGEMNEEWVSCFCEPALSIKLHQLFSEQDSEMFLYMDWSIYGWITFTLNNENIALVLEYLRKVKAGETDLPKVIEAKNKRRRELEKKYKGLDLPYEELEIYDELLAKYENSPAKKTEQGRVRFEVETEGTLPSTLAAWEDMF